MDAFTASAIDPTLVSANLSSFVSSRRIAQEVYLIARRFSSITYADVPRETARALWLLE
jgi:hypothetical protein